MIFGLVGNLEKDRLAETVRELMDRLHRSKASYVVDERILALIGGTSWPVPTQSTAGRLRHACAKLICWWPSVGMEPCSASRARWSGETCRSSA